MIGSAFMGGRPRPRTRDPDHKGKDEPITSPLLEASRPSFFFRLLSNHHPWPKAKRERMMISGEKTMGRRPEGRPRPWARSRLLFFQSIFSERDHGRQGLQEERVNLEKAAVDQLCFCWRLLSGSLSLQWRGREAERTSTADSCSAKLTKDQPSMIRVSRKMMSSRPLKASNGRTHDS